jgi:hypothetical protein
VTGSAAGAERRTVKTALRVPESDSVTSGSFTESEGASAAVEAAAVTRKRATTANVSWALTITFYALEAACEIAP